MATERAPLPPLPPLCGVYWWQEVGEVDCPVCQWLVNDWYARMKGWLRDV